MARAEKFLAMLRVVTQLAAMASRQTNIRLRKCGIELPASFCKGSLYFSRSRENGGMMGTAIVIGVMRRISKSLLI
jgi:hypothetical protein